MRWISGRRGAQTLLSAALILAAAPGTATIALPGSVPGGGIVAGVAGAAGGDGPYPAGGLSLGKSTVPEPVVSFGLAAPDTGPALLYGDLDPTRPAGVPAATTLVAIASDPVTGMLIAAGLTLPALAAFLRRRHRRRIAWGFVEQRDSPGCGRVWNRA